MEPSDPGGRAAGGWLPMRSFECLMTDDRSTVEQLTWMVVSDVERARQLASQELLQDEHLQAVVLRENGQEVFRATRSELLDAAPERRSFRQDSR